MNLDSFNKIIFIEDKDSGFVGKITDISQNNLLKNGIVGATFVTDEGNIIEKDVSLESIKEIAEEEFDERVDTILTILNVKISRIKKSFYDSANEEE